SHGSGIRNTSSSPGTPQTWGESRATSHDRAAIPKWQLCSSPSHTTCGGHGRRARPLETLTQNYRVENRALGRTGLEVSALGFGGGAVGGLMLGGDRKEQVRSVETALDAGVNYFDTAPSYGDGASEENLGHA